MVFILYFLPFGHKHWWKLMDVCGGSVVGVQEMALTYMPWSSYKPLSFSFLFQSWSYALEYATQDKGKPLCSDSDTNKLANLTAGYLAWALAFESGRHPRKTLELRDSNSLNKQLHTRSDFQRFSAPSGIWHRLALLDRRLQNRMFIPAVDICTQVQSNINAAVCRSAPESVYRRMWGHAPLYKTTSSVSIRAVRREPRFKGTSFLIL